MKKHLFTIAAVAFALCACQKAETGTNEVTPGVNEEVGAPQQILIGTNLKSSELVTKASVDYWNGQKVYVIGYDNAKIGTATGVSEEDGFIMPNIPGTAPIYDEDSDDSRKGQLGFTEKFYYDEDVKSYDFVGYYLGEGVEKAAGDITVENGIMTVDFEIDGTQDVLAATTDRLNAEERKFEEEEGVWKVVNKDYVYSAFAARRDVQPTLKFNHMLTKFSFKVKYGSKEGAEAFELKTIALATYTNGTLTLNPEDRKPVANYNGEAEAVKDTVKIINTGVAFENYTGVDDDNLYKQYGECMVLSGETSYNMKLTYFQGNTDDKDHDFSKDIEIVNVNWINDGDRTDTFQPGKHYVVYVTVYGLEEIKVDIELERWDEEGRVNIDPDDIPEAIGNYPEDGPTE